MAISLMLNLIWLGVLSFLLSILARIFFLKFTKLGILPDFVISFVSRILIIFFVIILIRIFLFEFYFISSKSMENAILPGDFVVISKIHYGPLLPKSIDDIPWMSFLFRTKKIKIDKVRSDGPNYERLNGFQEVTRNSILLFTSNYAQNPLIKRCIGLPGDTVVIKNGLISICEDSEVKNQTSKRLAKIWFNEFEPLVQFLLNIEVAANLNDSTKGYLYNPITNSQKAEISKLKWVDSITYDVDMRSSFLLESISSENTWTYDNLGPYVVPYSGYKINLTRATYSVYSRLIKTYEGSSIIEKDGDYFLEDKMVETFTFKNDYYFLMGDNRSNSMDSRAFGPICKSSILGKAVFHFSTNDWKFGLLR